ncbi:uncharacterized protein LOC144450262 [Glandiceps talaboti]
MLRFIISLSVLLIGVTVNTDAQDVDLKTLTVTDAQTITYKVDTPVKINFDLSAKAKNGGSDGSVTAINVYFCTYEEYSTVNASAAFSATFSPSPFPIPAGGTEDITNVNATLTLDSANCEAYSHVCAVATATGDTDDSNDYKCVGFGSASAKAGTKDDCPDAASRHATGISFILVSAMVVITRDLMF